MINEITLILKVLTIVHSYTIKLDTIDFIAHVRYYQDHIE